MSENEPIGRYRPAVGYSCGHEIPQDRLGMGGAPGKCPRCSAGTKLPSSLQPYRQSKPDERGTGSSQEAGPE